MPFLFWYDVALVAITLLLTASLSLLTIGFGPRERLNQAFTAFTLSLALWALFYLCSHLVFWIGKGNSLLFLELSIAAFCSTGSFLLMTTLRYLNLNYVWAELAAIIGLLLDVIFAIPLFQGKLISRTWITENGTFLADVTVWAVLAALIPGVTLAWSLILFWQNRKEAKTTYLANSALILLLGILLGGILQVNFPILSNTNLIAIVVLAYGVLSRQLFNPLSKRTQELQQQIVETTTAQEALRNNEAQLTSLLAAIPDTIIIFGKDGIIYNLFASGSKVFSELSRSMIGKNVQEVLPPRASEAIMVRINEALTKKEMVEYEYAMPDGIEMKWFQARLVTYEFQGEMRILWLSRNITAQKQAKEAQDKANTELIQAYTATLEGWSRALELRERETAGHSKRVVDLTLQLAIKLGMPEDRLINIQRGALLHDIGKLGIPDQILLKPGPLSGEEWEIMRQHPFFSFQLIESIPYLLPALDIPFYHHERWDGSGYPKGLKGEAIPLAARIFTVVDVWDALTSWRPYRPPWSEESVMKYLQEHAGRLFDPKVVEKFLLIEKFKKT